MPYVLGLKRGTVSLVPHQAEWEREAERTIERLRALVGDVIVDIQHVGSTSIKSIMAKPIIDIALAVKSFDDILKYEEKLRENGFYYRPKVTLGSQLLFGCGSFYEGTGDLQTHFIHVVIENSIDWINYINFRDYLNKKPSEAKKYEELKLSLAEQAPVDSGREKYLAGKSEFISYINRKALAFSYLGKTVTMRVDRAINTQHPSHKSIIYPLNYGYIPGAFSADGEEIDVYLLDVSEPVEEFTGKIIAIIHRLNDNEDKLVMAPLGISKTEEEIYSSVQFQERFFQTEIELEEK